MEHATTSMDKHEDYTFTADSIWIMKINSTLWFTYWSPFALLNSAINTLFTSSKFNTSMKPMLPIVHIQVARAVSSECFTTHHFMANSSSFGEYKFTLVAPQSSFFCSLCLAQVSLNPSHDSLLDHKSRLAYARKCSKLKLKWQVEGSLWINFDSLLSRD